MTIFGYRVPMMASLLVWCVVWEIVGQTGIMFILPPFSDVLAALVELVLHVVREATFPADELLEYQTQASTAIRNAMSEPSAFRHISSWQRPPLAERGRLFRTADICLRRKPRAQTGTATRNTILRGRFTLNDGALV